MLCYSGIAFGGSLEKQCGRVKMTQPIRALDSKATYPSSKSCATFKTQKDFKFLNVFLKNFERSYEVFNQREV